jgi:xanthine dehydrogenase accessory factor
MAATTSGETTAPLVVVHGETPIARAVLALSAALGYRAIPFEDAARDGAALHDAAAVVTATHGGSGEDAVLRAALDAGVPYVGLVASRSRGSGVVAGLGLDPAAAARLHTPAGLDIGARTPHEVALAILAEVVATRPRVPGQSRAARGKQACDHRGASPEG